MRLIPPPLLALSAAVAQGALTRGAAAPGARRAAGAATLAAVSGAFAAASAREFGRRGTTVEPFHPEQASVLVTTGANSITRNPMYLGLSGLLVANAVRRGSWAALVPLAGFVVLVDRLQIAAEESALRARFGAEYDAYYAAVPRWLDRRSAQSAGASVRSRISSRT